MNRGDVWVADLGSKAGTRPVVILTRSAVIPHLNKVTVAEITTQGKGYPTEVDIGQQANLPHHSYVQLDNIQTIPRQRLTKFVGALDNVSMRAISQKVIMALNLEDAF
ncbi:MAG: type II toxin-antitoxin system PemK/MazF family toxin [Blastocatellia bacterium]